MDKIAPFLWFDGRAEEAARFYVSIFKDSKINKISHYLEGSPGEPGSVMTVEFELEGQSFIALNGGPEFKFNPAVSFSIGCDSQEEVDYYWEKLVDGGEEVQCGWLTDRFGLSWQVVPKTMMELLHDPDKGKAQRAFTAMMGMVKLDVEELKRAAEG